MQSKNANLKLLISKYQVDNVMHTLSKSIIKKFEKKELVILSVMDGAAYLSVKLSQKMGKMGFNHCFHAICSSSYEGQVQLPKPKLFFGDIMKYKDFEVLIFDELFDTGNTFYEVKKALIDEYGFEENKITTCSVFAKDKKVNHPLPDFLGITIHDVWVVGCGLDDNGFSRYLEDLYAIPKSSELSHLESEHDRMFTDEEYYDKFYENGWYIPRTNPNSV